MKMKFALWKYEEDRFGEITATSPVLVDSWSEVYTKNKEGYKLPGLTYNIFQMFKALEYNKYFLEERREFRKKFNIPNRVDFKKYLENTRYFENKKITKANFTTSSMIKELAYLGNLGDKYRMPNHIKELLRDLFYTGIVRFIPPYGGDINIAIYPKRKWIAPRSITLEITSPNITKNALKKFIDQHWDILQSDIARLPAENRLTISEQDLKLMNLRQKYKTIGRVATEIYMANNSGDIFNGKEIDVNDAAVKTAYFRAKEKIEELFRPSLQKKKKMH